MDMPEMKTLCSPVYIGLVLSSMFTVVLEILYIESLFFYQNES